MSATRHIAALALAAFVAPAVAFAGTSADFEKDLRSAYGSYRAALFQTNAGNAEASRTALAKFSGAWQALNATYGAEVPPPYENAEAFDGMLKTVGEIASKAGEAIKAGNLPEAHEDLEGIRDAIGSVREEAGVIGFSDRMNAYHAKMEEVLGGDYAKLDAATVGTLREEAAVLSYLASQIVGHPAPEADDPAYAGLVKAFGDSVDALLASARSGDETAIRAAIAGLKVPYAKLFAKFG